MATQPVDRQKAKHAFKTAPKQKPSLVNRTNKCVLRNLVPGHVLVSRFQGERHARRCEYW